MDVFHSMLAFLPSQENSSILTCQQYEIFSIFCSHLHLWLSRGWTSGTCWIFRSWNYGFSNGSKSFKGWVVMIYFLFSLQKLISLICSDILLKQLTRYWILRKRWDRESVKYIEAIEVYDLAFFVSIYLLRFVWDITKYYSHIRILLNSLLSPSFSDVFLFCMQAIQMVLGIDEIDNILQFSFCL